MQNKANIIDKINHRIGKILGKSSQKPNLNESKPVSNIIFFSLIFICFLLLWGTTGVRYIGDNQSAIIFRGSKLVGVYKGATVDFDFPSPFSDAIVFDTGESKKLYIGQQFGGFSVLTKDLIPLMIDSDFTYKITSPQLAYKYMVDDKADFAVTILIEEQLTNKFKQFNYKDITDYNQIVLSNDFMLDINRNISNKYGFTLVNFNLSSIGKLDLNKDDKNITQDNLETPSRKLFAKQVANELILEAYNYNKDKISIANTTVEQFNQLLPEYRKYPQTIVGQLYYDLLNNIPSKNFDNYKLLSLTLPELINIINSTTINQQQLQQNSLTNTHDISESFANSRVSKKLYLREVNRDVRRLRDLERKFY